eukprot:RCo038762
MAETTSAIEKPVLDSAAVTEQPVLAACVTTSGDTPAPPPVEAVQDSQGLGAQKSPGKRKKGKGKGKGTHLDLTIGDKVEADEVTELKREEGLAASASAAEADAKAEAEDDAVEKEKEEEAEAELEGLQEPDSRGG